MDSGEKFGCFLVIIIFLFCGISALAGPIVGSIITVAIIGFFVYFYIQNTKKEKRKHEEWEKEKEKYQVENHKKAIVFFEKLCQKYILLGTDVYLSHFNIGLIGKFCKENSTAILMPGVQYNELESSPKIEDWRLKQIAEMVKDGRIKIEGMNYSPTKVSRTATIDALVKFAEKAIQENTSFVYITDDTSISVRINCLTGNNNIIEIHSVQEIQSVMNNY